MHWNSTTHVLIDHAMDQRESRNLFYKFYKHTFCITEMYYTSLGSGDDNHDDALVCHIQIPLSVEK